MKVINSLLIVSLLALTACGGRMPNPVMISQYGDQEKSCESLRYEMNIIEGEMQSLLPKTDKTGKNIALGVTGAVCFVPWFFMDFKNGERAEYEALRQRHRHLAGIAMSKNCDFEYNEYPSVQEMKEQCEEAEEAKK